MPASPQKGPWEILIVDDEHEVHDITATVLKDVVFDGQPLRFHNAYSTMEAKKIIATVPNIALSLLDQIMEDEDSGLQLVRHIREERGNRTMRIILRTGVGGNAPQRRIVNEYEINDYRTKAELSSGKLFTSVVKSLRNYRDLMRIERINQQLHSSREGLSRMISATGSLLSSRNPHDFLQGMAEEAASLLSPHPSVMVTDADFHAVLAAAGNLKNPELLNSAQQLGLRQHIEKALLRHHVTCVDDVAAGRITAEGHPPLRIIAEFPHPPNLLQKGLFGVFVDNANILYRNLALEKDSRTTQTEVIGLLGDIIENRSNEHRSHVMRVAEYAAVIAKKVRFNDGELNLLRDALPMHDVGKIGIGDSILRKQESLTSLEFEEMKKHTEIGYEILRFSGRQLFQMAALIAREHHERWNGSGYPRGLAGERISLLGRIAGIADVFDSLLSHRSYRQAWDLNQAIRYLQDGRGTLFDPRLTDLFLEDEKQIQEITTRYGDNESSDGEE